MEIATEVTYRIYKPLGSINLFCNVTNNLKTLITKDLSVFEVLRYLANRYLSIHSLSPLF